VSIDFANRDIEDGLGVWAAATGASVTLETSSPIFGINSLNVNTPGSVALEGVQSGTGSSMDATVSAATEYTLSVHVKADVASTWTMRVTQRTADGSTSLGNVTSDALSVTGSNVLDRVSWTFTTVASTGLLRDYRLFTRSTAQDVTAIMDGWQLDLGPVPLTYDGDDAGGEPEPPIQDAPETLIIVRSNLRAG
jgi:hypothetical protein